MEPLKVAWDKAAYLTPKRLSETLGLKTVSGTKKALLRVMDKECAVDFGSKTMTYMDPGEKEVPPHLQILVLHYLEGANRVQLANRLVTFREFEGGAIYYPAFKARTIDVIVKEFGDKPDLLRRIGEAMRGEPVDVGSVGFKVHFFPKVPVVVVLWLGDEEVPAAANMLFDANAGKVLPTEDISVMGGALTRRLLKLARA
jgi:hypothetical protein